MKSSGARGEFERAMARRNERSGGRESQRQEGPPPRGSSRGPTWREPVEILQHEVNRVFDGILGSRMFSSFGGAQADLGGAMRWPNVDVSIEPELVHVECDLPGLEQNDVDVTVDAQQIVISGAHRTESDEESRRYTRRERTRGSFERTIPLPPDAVPEQARAQFRNGVLTVDVPRQVDEKSRPRRVPINDEG
jgi:HSP20 family protein